MEWDHCSKIRKKLQLTENDSFLLCIGVYIYFLNNLQLMKNVKYFYFGIHDVVKSWIICYFFSFNNVFQWKNRFEHLKYSPNE